MSLYRPPLRETSRKDNNSAPDINTAIEGFILEYYFTGKRIGKDLIDLTVCTLIEDSTDNLFLRICTYSGLKNKWKEVILKQVEQQLKDLGVEQGFINSETRYLEITSEQHLENEQFQKLYNNLKGKVNRKRDENNPL